MTKARDLADFAGKADTIETSATADQTAAEIRAAVEAATDSNVFTDADHTKLNAIEASSTGDQTAAQILTAIKTVDGAASALDADLLDGQHGAYYTGYADTAVSNLVDSSPASLNTLNELAAALGDNASFSTTVTNSIAAKLPLAGGAMTGAITTNSTFDGRDVAADGVLATNALPKSGGIITGVLTSNGGAVFNENAAAVDFRIQSEDNEQIFIVDGDKNAIGINASDLPTDLPLTIMNSAHQTDFSLVALGIGGNEADDAVGVKSSIGFGYVSAARPIMPAVIAYETKSTSGGTFGDLVFGTRPDVSNTQPTVRMTIKSDGNVGLGPVSSPQRQLVLYSPTASGQTQLQFQNSTTGAASGDGFGVGLDTAEKGFIWNYENTDTYIGGSSGTSITVAGSSSNVGIGATDPGGSRLYLQDNHTTNVTNAATLIGNTTFTINGNSGEGSDVMRMGPMSVGVGSYFIDVSNGGGSAEYPLLLNPISGGKVGIGITAPANMLHVSNSGHTRIEVDSSGNNSAGVFFKTINGSTQTGNGTIRTANDGSMQFFTGTTSDAERLRIDADGIKFHGDTAAANGLSDFETGGWTPAFVSGTISYSQQSGSYVKIGRLVTVQVTLAVSSVSGMSGNLRIGGLPFSPVSGPWGAGPYTANLLNTLDGPSSLSRYATSHIGILSSGAGGGSWTWEAASIIVSGTTIRGTFTYETNS